MRVLLVEDYEPLRKSLEQGLHEAGYALDAAADGDEGLWYALGNDYDVIILDLMLPGTDGLSILQKLRARKKDAPVLILTAKDTVRDRVTGLDFGADDYLVKPFAFEELLARIRALIRRNYNKKTSRIVVEDLHIDLNARQVRRGGRLIPLTAREYELLSRTDIWEHVYEFNSSAASNVVDVYIGYLRKKLQRAGGPPLLHTIRGQGYLLGSRP